MPSDNEPTIVLSFPCEIIYTDPSTLQPVRFLAGTYPVPLRLLADGYVLNCIQVETNIIRARWAADQARLGIPLTASLPPLPVPPIPQLQLLPLPPPAPPPPAAPPPTNAGQQFGRLIETSVKVGEVVGWRVWRVERGYLKSFAMERFWSPGEPMTGGPVQPNSDLGVWAFKERQPALDKIYVEANHATMAYGAVQLWGTVVEHEIGWRAENARVVVIEDISGKISGRTADERRKSSRLRRQRLFQLRRRYGLHGDFADWQRRARAAAT